MRAAILGLQVALLACSTPTKPPPASPEIFALDGQWRLLTRISGGDLDLSFPSWDFWLTSAEDASVAYIRWDRDKFRASVTEVGVEGRIPFERVSFDQPSADWPNMRFLPDHSLLITDWRKQKSDDTTWTSWVKPGLPIRDLTRCTQSMDATPVVLADGTIQLAFALDCGRSDCGYGRTFWAHLRPDGAVVATCEQPQQVRYWAPNPEGTQYFGNYDEGSATAGFTVKGEKIVDYQRHIWNDKRPNVSEVFAWAGGEPPTVFLGTASSRPDGVHTQYFYKLVGFDDQTNLQEVVVQGSEGLEPQWWPGRTRSHKGKLVWYDAGKQSLVVLDPKTKAVSLVPLAMRPTPWPSPGRVRLASDGKSLYIAQYLNSRGTGGANEFWARQITELPDSP